MSLNPQSSTTLPSLQLCILIPVFNDWPVVEVLAKQLDAVLSERGFQAELVLIDDGSTTAPSALVHNPQALQKVEIVTLRKNLGHQRALCVGLVYVHQTRPGSTVMILDADGEDNPRDIIALLERFCEVGGEKVVFAARSKRAEGFVFQFFYRMFQLVHYLLVGFGTQIGNFSVIPPRILDRLVIVPEVWNHYAAAVVKSRFPIDQIPLARSKRLLGRSKMSFVNLIIHGLSAISVYGDTVGVRLLLVSSTLSAFWLAGLVVILIIRFGTTLAIPGWATYTAGLVLMGLLQSFLISLVFTFMVLYSRAHPSFIPSHDCPLYIGVTRTVFPLNERV
jgi:glycosyltransferase involved in cell wall biosynthesis